MRPWLLVALTQCIGDASARSKQFPPGFNGLAKTPPMGWRSWNAFGNRITQDMMLAAAEALVAKNRTVRGVHGLSLCDLGYCSVGVDEGWEGCGEGVNGTQHTARGDPTIDTSTFPDSAKMVDQIHALNLSAGWYLNGCKCGERAERAINYQGDVRSLDGFAFDGVKIDDCGAQRNMTYYAELIQQTGRSFTIENCHWGHCTESDDSSCPTHEWCPFNWFRTSGDINAGSESWFSNLQTTIPFQDRDAPLSQPGCWAYPDMLEVGRVVEPALGAGFVWNRAHFGAWCIVSAPLILGLELSDEKLTPILDIIGNTQAIAINQAWAGHPGGLFETIKAPPVPYDPSGAVIPSSSPVDFELSGGASITAGKADALTSGHASIRTGNPGATSTIRIGAGFIGKGHRLDRVRLQFRYSAGYTPPPGETKQAPTVRVLLLDAATGGVVREVYASGTLGNFSWDHFISYSPPISVDVANLGLMNDEALVLALEVKNNERNLQLPIDDLAAGFGAQISWESPEKEAAMVEVPLQSPHAPRIADPLIAGQLWTKRLPSGMALLLINHSPAPLSHTVTLVALNLTAPAYEALDVWTHTGFGPIMGNISLSVPPFDSAFLRLDETMAAAAA